MSHQRLHLSFVLSLFAVWSCAGQISERESGFENQQSSQGAAFNKGRRVKSGTKRFHTTQQYDVLGRVVTDTYSVEGQPYVFKSEFGYAGGARVGTELGNRLIASVFPDGERVEPSVDAGGNLQRTVSRLQGEGASALVYADILSGATKFNRHSLPEWSDAGDGTRTHYIYDSVRRLAGKVTERKSDAVVLQSFGYAYDSLGRILHANDYCSWETGTAVCCDMRMQSCAPAEMSASYSYDVAGWLSSETQNGVTRTYIVDAIHNLVSKNGDIETYSNANHPHAVTRLTSADGRGIGSYTYNEVGSLTRMEEEGIVTSFQWNANNMPVRTTRGKDVTERAYVGESLFKRRDIHNGQETVTYFLPSLRIENAVFRKNYGVAERESQPSSGDMSARRGQLRFFHSNHVGSSTLVTDANGIPVHRAVYEPYGAERKKEGLFTPKYEFGGKEKEAISGLYDFGARLYNPRIGRFVSVDSVMDGLNPYAYVRNEPINHIDPTGHEGKKVQQAQAEKRDVLNANELVLVGDTYYTPEEIGQQQTKVPEGQVDPTSSFGASFMTHAIDGARERIWGLLDAVTNPATLLSVPVDLAHVLADTTQSMMSGQWAEDARSLLLETDWAGGEGGFVVANGAWIVADGFIAKWATKVKAPAGNVLYASGLNKLRKLTLMYKEYELKNAQKAATDLFGSDKNVQTQIDDVIRRLAHSEELMDVKLIYNPKNKNKAVPGLMEAHAGRFGRVIYSIENDGVAIWAKYDCRGFKHGVGYTSTHQSNFIQGVIDAYEVHKGLRPLSH